LKHTYFKSEYIVSIAVFIILSFVLLQNPIIGKRNNGDFGRTICISGVDDLSNSYNDAEFKYTNSSGIEQKGHISFDISGGRFYFSIPERSGGPNGTMYDSNFSMVFDE
jgi:hypothetical protein